ncbi:hypothetical protein [Actinocrispum wychmicini]|uniref:hypothetical protein n=1 Tax=Actinocrispum wychmicini TaxID=1213861 RepID=UPI0010456BEC|nr:hypothetical protein [Actinocrispum wychmicini]
MTDIVGFSEPYRTHRDQLVIRTGLYQALEHAFHQAGVLWNECYHEDRGDGVLVLAPPHIPKEYFATRLPRALAAEIAHHNAEHPETARIRVRLALHAGEITFDAHGVSAPALVHAFRLIDAPAFKKELVTSSVLVGIVVSSWYFDEVIQQLRTHVPSDYRRIRVHGKSTIAIAWVTCVHRTTRELITASPSVVHLESHRVGRHRLYP